MENTQWDLRRMFATDEQWREKLAALQELAGKLAARRGHCADSAASLCETASLYTAMQELMEEVAVFANSNFDQDLGNSAAKDLYESMQNAATGIGEQLSFLAPELMQYSMADFEGYCKEQEELKLYTRFAEDFFEKKAHVLPAEQENLLVRMNDLGASFDKIYEDLMINDVRFPTIQTPDGEDFEVIEANYSTALTSSDREFREKYFKSLLGTYGQHIHALSSIYYGSVKNDVFAAKSRNYTSARQYALKQNHIPEEVYDSLLRTVRENTGPMNDYVEYRRQKLGLDEVHFYDLFVPMVQEVSCRYTYEEAQQMVLKATAVLGTDYTALVQRAFDERWIDVYPRKAKRTGAYSTGSYRSYPYILLNFSGTLDDVFTLAHELGHSMHTYFSNQNQPSIYSGYSIFCAEVASTLNEQLLSDYLYRTADSDAMRALLLDKRLNDLRSTFYRQTMFADFENETHRLVEEGKPLLPDQLTGFYAGLNRTYYGDHFVVDRELSYEWSRIPHFYRAFYVYQYATGIAAATSIAKRILTQGQPAVDAYRQFLCGGGSKHPIDMLRVAGVDMASPQPVLDTAETFRQTLEALKQANG